MYRVSVPIADVFYAVFGSRRESARGNYARILGRSIDDPLVERLARGSFRHFGRYVVELMHVQGWTIDRLRESVEITGEEHFEEARAHGRGVIFTSAHMGSAEVASAILLLKGYRVTAVTEQLRPKVVMDWLVTCRAKMGITLLPARGKGISLLRTLRQNEMVAMVVDVGVNSSVGIPVRFLGQESLFPAGPARLARMSGAPIIFGLAVRKPGNRYWAYISPPMFANRELGAEEDVQQLTQRIVDELERFVRRYPAQWYVFRDMFPTDDRTA